MKKDEIISTVEKYSECSCCKESYFPFHLHTVDSVRDGTNSVKEQVERFVELGYKRYIPTDHGNLNALYDSFKHCEDKGIQAGIGCEFYLTLDNDREKNYHITVIVKNDIGYRNILKLNYLSNCKADEFELEGFKGSFYGKARITEKMLFHFSEGLIITSGCRLSIFNQMFIKGKHSEAYALLDLFKDNIKDFMIELHVAKSEVEEDLFRLLLDYSKNNNLKTVVANDIHYLKKDDLISWQLLNAQRHGNNFFNTEGQIKNPDFHIKSFNEIFLDTFRCVSKKYLLENYNNDDIKHSFIEESSDYKFTESSHYRFLENFKEEEINKLIIDTESCFNGFKYLDNEIKFNWFDNWNNRKLPSLKFENSEKELKQMIKEGMVEEFGSVKNIPPNYIERIKKELEFGKITNNIDYFYFVGKLIKRCFDNDIMLSLGRGSAGSLLLGKYIKFHDLDAIKYDLIIERAMNPDRKKLMDIDLDFASTERAKVVKILEEDYGKQNTVAIANFGFNQVKQAFQIICSYLNVPSYVADKVSKELTQIAKKRAYSSEEDEQIKVTIEDIYQTDFYKNFDMYGLTGDDFVDYVKRVTGTINNTSIHASGILVMNDPVYEKIPVVRVKDVICSAYDMKILEELNGLKIDILAVSVYDLIKDGLNILKKYNL